MFSLHADVKDLVVVTDERRESLDKSVALLSERLLTELCRTETKEALKFEGVQTLEASFQILGQVAGRQLATDPKVAAGMAGFSKHLNRQKFEELGSEMQR